MPKSVRKLVVHFNVDQRIRKLRLEAYKRIAENFAAKMDEALYKHIIRDVSSAE